MKKTRRPGLGVLPGRARRLPGGVKTPHMGWNTVTPCPAADGRSFLDAAPAYFYFVHSYYVEPAAEIAICDGRHDALRAGVLQRAGAGAALGRAVSPGEERAGGTAAAGPVRRAGGGLMEILPAIDIKDGRVRAAVPGRLTRR